MAARDDAHLGQWLIGTPRPRMDRACSTSVMSVALVESRFRASQVTIGTCGPIVSASRMSSMAWV